MDERAPHAEFTPEPVADKSSLDLRDVLHEISASIRWLSRVRDGPSHQPEAGMAAISAQTGLVEQYRLLLNAVDTLKRLEQGEHIMGRIEADLQHRNGE